jgi:tetratricopeptide (TPR) repeat protein
VFKENDDFTVQERIVLHLSKYNGFRNHYLNPESVTQEGIARAVGIARNHVPRALSRLKGVDLVEETRGRVKGSPRRKKVYFLSEKGMGMISSLREKLRIAETATYDIPGAPGFVGREKEVREIKKALGTGKSVLLTGANGLGKTYLASNIALDVSKSKAVMWFDVPAGVSLNRFLRELSGFLNRSGAGLLGYRLSAASAIGDREIIDILAGTMKPALIVVDDLQNADAELIRFIEMLAASRVEGLGLLLVSEGRIHKTKGLLKVSLAPLDRESVRKAMEARGAGSMCDALEVATSNPIFLKLVGNKPHSSLEEFLDAEFAVMPEDEKRAMWAVSLFHASVKLELLAATGNVDYQVTVNLAERGLLRELGGGAFDTHVLLKKFFLSTMPESEGRAMHLRAARKLGESRDTESWLEAQRHLLAAGAGNECARSVVATGLKIINKGLRRELEEIIGLLDRENLDENQRAEVLLLKGYAAKLRGEWDKALGEYGKAIAIFTELGAREKIADALAKIGRVHLEKGEFDRAREIFGEGLGKLGRGSHVVRARILDELATIHLRKRETEEAREKVGKAMGEAIKIGDREMEARIHNTMGNLHMTLGSFPEAKLHYELSLEGLKDVDEQMAVILCNNLAIIEFKSGNVDRAIELWETAAGKAEAMKSLNVMLTFSNLGSIHFSIGNWDRAAECCIKALEISEMVGKDMITAAARSTLGHLALYRDQPGWREHYQKALELRTKLGDKNGMASSLNDISKGLNRGGDLTGAQKQAAAALELAIQKEDREQEVNSRLHLADAAVDGKEYVEAKKFLKQALIGAREIGSGELLGRVYRTVGTVSASEGEDFVAEKYLKESVDILEGERRPLELAISLERYGLFLRESGLGKPDPYLERSAEILSCLGIADSHPK